MAEALGNGLRMASALSLGVISLHAAAGQAQSHSHSEGCEDESLAMHSDSAWNKNANDPGGKKSQFGDSVLYINQIKDGDILWHPLLSEEEAMNVVQHKQRFGDILDPAELIQCGFSVERIAAIQKFLVCDIPLQWQWKQWLAAAQTCKTTVLMGGKTLWNDIGSSEGSGYQMQVRINNNKTVSLGASLQRDPGEWFRIVPNRKNLSAIFTNYHLRVSAFRGIESLIFGRYTLQLGQGLVQAGMSGFWNAPIIWARRTPDWGLSEKRGWDEYQGHTGLAMGYRVLGGRLRVITAVSRGRVSARLDSMGGMSSLITDGNFASERQRAYQNNTWQEHVTGALLLGKAGASWSSYRYDRMWQSKADWPRPALRAGRMFHYPECWITQHTPGGGLAFMHLALQYQPNQTPKPAAVAGWILPLNRQSDISLRGYVIHNQFRPPQGLFNQLSPNHWSGSATFSHGTTGKQSLRWAVELKQPLLPNQNLERPLSYRHQCLWEQRLKNHLHLQGIWQWNNEIIPTKPEHKITLILKYQQNPANTLEHQITIVPQPQSSQASCLYAFTFIHRHPFSPLKWAAECIAFDTETPLYFTQQTLPHEITHFTLSQKGIALNTLLQYTLKHNLSHHHNKHPHWQIHMAARSEIIIKNTTENPLQPRIFVSLWLK